MKFSFCSDAPGAVAADLLALGAFEGQLSESPGFIPLDRMLDGKLAQLAAQEDFQAKDEQTFLLHTLDRLPALRLLVVGLGRREEFHVPDTRRYGAVVAQAAQRAGCSSAAMMLPALDPAAHELAVQFLVEGVLLGSYRFEKYRSKDATTPDKLAQVKILVPEEPLALARGEIVARAVAMARDLVNEPAGKLTPRALAEAAEALAQEKGLDCKVLGPKECERQRMRLLLAVAQGSVEEPRFVHLTYRPKGKERARRKVVIVGKAVTFDSGGLSLKPAASMLDMKTDMAGAAAALGVAQALPSLGLKSEVHVLIPAAENMPSGSACKIGDIVTGLGGKTVEIVNTDAEGRLTLADALSYATKLAPDEVIDLATLTAACVVALGPHIAGVMGNDRSFVEHFLAAARRAGEEMWPLPLPERLKEQLKSPIADLKNSGERWGGALLGGLFLKEFVGKVPWVHVDIAGPASAEKDAGHIRKGGTGFGVSAVLEYLLSRDDAG